MIVESDWGENRLKYKKYCKKSSDIAKKELVRGLL